MQNEFLNSKKNIVSVLAYFDMFHYPLTLTEISQFLPVAHTRSELEEGLISLLFDKSIFLIGEFYSLQDDPELVKRRLKGNLKAAQMMKTAKKVGEILSQVPFIKGLAVSGSLSKNFADNKSDIDHFLITTTNRLWIARTFLFFLRKIASIFGKQDRLCLNYFIDEQELRIKDKNIYTAMELVTLANPLGKSTYDHFLMANTWAREFFPNHKYYISSAQPIKENLLKRTIERILDNPLGDWLDNYLMNLTSSIWEQERVSGKMNEKNQVRMVSFGKHFTKLNPENFQEVFLNQYYQKLSFLHMQMDQEINPSNKRISGMV